MFRIQSQRNIWATVYDSVLLNSGGNMLEKEDNVLLTLENGFYHVSGNLDSDVNLVAGCTPVDNNTDHIMTFQLFINGTYCQGINYSKDDLIKGCSVEDCINQHSICPRTIGFPPGVVGYPTFIDSQMQTNFFTPSKTFNVFTRFTYSSLFSATTDFTPSKSFKNKVEIVVNENKSKNKSAVIGGAIAAAVFGVGLIAAIIAFIIIKNRRRELSSDMFEELNAIDHTSSTITYNNVLHGLDMSDDPFEDDFHMDH